MAEKEANAPETSETTEDTKKSQENSSVTNEKLPFCRTCIRDTCYFVRLYWKSMFTVFWALILITLPVVYNCPETRCAYVVLLMVGYWVTESLPIPISSTIPVVLFPTLGILSTLETCLCYMNDTVMVFLGGLVLAIATEHCNLHLRVALLVMKTLGCSHAKLLGGICTVTALISMWIANAAATAMAVPIVFAVLDELEKQGFGKVFEESNADPEDPRAELTLKPTNITKAYLLASAYASTFGGTGTLVGSPTNLAFKGIYESTFPEAKPINFAEWMAGSIPQMVINCVILWFYLRIAYLGYLRPQSRDARMARIGSEGEEVTNRVIRQKLENLGPMTFHEISVAVLFAGCIFLWIFRAPGFVLGWSELLTTTSLTDSTPVVFVCILMFFIPKEPNFIYFFGNNLQHRLSVFRGQVTYYITPYVSSQQLVFLDRRFEKASAFIRGYYNLGSDSKEDALEVTFLPRRWIRNLKRYSGVRPRQDNRTNSLTLKKFAPNFDAQRRLNFRQYLHRVYIQRWNRQYRPSRGWPHGKIPRQRVSVLNATDALVANIPMYRLTEIFKRENYFTTPTTHPHSNSGSLSPTLPFSVWP